MDALQAIVLGIVQGLTEFLPISSSGHLRIVPAIFGWEDPGTAFTAVVQLGTMAAVLLYFRRDLWRIAVAWLRGLRDAEVRRTLDARMGWYIIVGTIPISVLGVLFDDPIEHEFRSLYLIGSTLIAFGALMWLADALSKRRRTIEALRARDGIAVGFAQALALVPGVSRSGATISAGLVLGFDRETAARFSFLLSVPAVVLSGLYQLRDIGGAGSASASATVIATVLAFVSGYASIAFLLRYLARHGLGIFVGYRFVVGTAVIVLAATGAIA